MRHNTDLRLRAVKASYQEGMTILKTAILFAIGVATLTRWRKTYRDTNSVEGKSPPKGPPPLIGPDELSTLSRLVEENSDATIGELTISLSKAVGRTFSTGTVSRALKKLGVTRKKKRSHPSNNIQLELKIYAKNFKRK